ncbi:LCP family protein [Sphaerisporangium sp. NBC_01403]|uniref:LCP family protein n=1 Tax=Sphaerisporangium sp. NBC_01403 TaxID=2903599 RepID=UPI003244412C
MDDLAMLRDLGRDLEHEPPATLAHQRHRLLGMTAGEGSRRDLSGASSRRGLFGAITGGGRRRLTGRMRWMTLAVVAGVTAALVVVPTVLLRGTPASRTLTPPTWDRPPKQNEALNVLVVGSDMRPGPRGMPANLNLGERSDVMILLHLSADRKNVTVVSLPRDSMVRMPTCATGSGQVSMINQAFNVGGLKCAWKTVESATGVHVDHAIEIRYSGFKEMVDALGGVEVTLPTAVDDPKSKLRLSAGRHHLGGEQALAYVRTRYGLGDGSDLGRIKRQQAFMNAMLKQVTGHLKEPDRLAAFVDVVRRSITTDEGLDLETMYSIARNVHEAGARVRFVTVPWQPYREDPNRLEWKQPEAAQLFAKLKHD